MAERPENCNCLAGTAYIDAEGNCRCTDAATVGPLPPLSTGGIRLRLMRPQTINYNYNLPLQPASPATVALADKAADTGTIFGLPPLAVLAVAAAGLYFLSSKDGKNA